MRRRGIVAATALLVVAAIGCQDGDRTDGALTPDGDGEVPVDQPQPPQVRSLALAGYRQVDGSGTTFALTGVEVDDHGFLHVGIDAIYSGGFDADAGISLSREPIRIADDRGNVYRMVPPDDHPELRLRRDQRAFGTLAFLPALDPDATRFTFANNSVGSDPDGWDRSGPGLVVPRFVFEDVPLPGVGLDHLAIREGDELLRAREIELDVSEDHPVAEGVTVTLTAIRVDGQNVEVDLDAVNRSGRTIALANDEPLLRGGGQFIYAPIEVDDASSRRLELQPGEEASVTLGFRGALGEDADTFRLTLNWLSSGSVENISPRFEFRDLPIPR